MFKDLPLLVNLGIFLACASVVWLAGWRLARYADAIAECTGIGRAFLGLLLLGGVTSLPELAIATTATIGGQPDLSINDVLGSAAINLVLLAIADAALGRDALTSKPGSPLVLLQAVAGVVLLSIVVAPSIAGDVLVLGMGAWSWAMVFVYLVALWVLARSQGLRSWVPIGNDGPGKQEPEQAAEQRSLRALVGLAAIAGVTILATGFVLTRSAEALAEQTGLGTSFFGAVILGFATSLPELSTVLSAVKLRQYEMAMADIFGTNLFNVTIIALVDALHPGGPVLLEAGRFASFAALLAIIMTGLFLFGLIERRDRTVARMGVDSLTVLAVYAAGVAVLYHLKD